MIRLVMIDSDRTFCSRVTEEARLAGDIDVVAVLHDDRNALPTIRRSAAQVVLLELAPPEVDGLQLLQHLCNDPSGPKIFVTGHSTDEGKLARAVSMGAHYCIVKPFDISTLLRRMRQFVPAGPPLLRANDESRRQQVESAVAERLHKLGVPRHFKGYHYLVDAIRLVVYDLTLLHTVTKDLYPSIARRHNTSPERVERAIRNAIEVTMTRGNLSEIQRVFGYLVDVGKGKPSNSSFIARLADQVRIELRVS